MKTAKRSFFSSLVAMFLLWGVATVCIAFLAGLAGFVYVLSKGFL